MMAYGPIVTCPRYLVKHRPTRLHHCSNHMQLQKEPVSPCAALSLQWANRELKDNQKGGCEATHRQRQRQSERATLRARERETERQTHTETGRVT